MRRAILFALGVAAIAGVTGCGAARVHVSAPTVGGIPADRPPSPETWPAYPHFSEPSCWARPFIGGHLVSQNAPSYVPAPRAHPIPPAVVVHRLLARLGDRRFIRSIVLTPAPPAVGGNVHRLYADGHPPTGALREKIVVRGTHLPPHASPAQNLRAGIAEYEASVASGALRDDMCDAGGPPLVMYGQGFAESSNAIDQRFPNPSPPAFRKRVELVGRHFGFRIASLLLLRPRQIAPALIVKTNRPRAAFVKDIGRIVQLLDPHTTRFGTRVGETFEAFFFAVEDAKGPFAYVESESREGGGGGEWAATRFLLPYPTDGPIVRNPKPCP